MIHKTPTILVADDDRSIRMILKQALSRAKYQVILTENANDLWELIQQDKGDVVITDISLPDMNGFDLISKIKKINPHIPIIVISALSTFSTALQAAEQNTFEYLPKPFDLTELLTTVKRALSDKEEINQPSSLLSTSQDEPLPFVGQSVAMQAIYRNIAKLTNIDLTVVITGDSGTGKALVAKSLHEHSHRKEFNFITMNMGSISKEELDSLFIDYKNQTTFKSSHQNYFTKAENGTLFLDEIGGMTLDAQNSLLQIIEYITSSSNNSNIRIVASTHQNLLKLVEDNRFREDLYYRLNIIPIELPSLYDRKEDIPLLIEYFIQKENTPIQISKKAMDLLQQYRWPGNIRELKNLITRLSALYPNQIVEDDLIIQILQPVAIIKSTEYYDQNISLSQVIENYIRQYFMDNKGLSTHNLHTKMIIEIERPLIKQTLIETNGNQIKAAAILGINRNTLRKKIKDLNITYTDKKNI